MRAAVVTLASVSLHLALAVAFVLRPQPPALAPASQGVIAVSLVAAPPGRRSPEPVESTPPSQDVAVLEPAAVAPEPEVATPAVEGACAVSEVVLAALKADAPRAALGRIPRPRRSAANKVGPPFRAGPATFGRLL